MENNVKLQRTYGAGGYTGWVDSFGSVFSVLAKMSNFAEPEQNAKLEAALHEAYKAYLEEVAETHNGRY